MISALFPLVLLWIIGFASGYEVREVMARHRRAVAREKFYREHPELRR